jgi:hypothetical protein
MVSSAPHQLTVVDELTFELTRSAARVLAL